jgi:hypothetical protein
MHGSQMHLIYGNLTFQIGSVDNMETLSDKFTYWKAVRARLTDTIQDFYDACTLLDISCSQMGSEKFELEERLVYLDS